MRPAKKVEKPDTPIIRVAEAMMAAMHEHPEFTEDMKIAVVTAEVGDEPDAEGEVELTAGVHVHGFNSMQLVHSLIYSAQSVADESGQMAISVHAIRPDMN